MAQDLRRRLDSLFVMNMQPALHLSKKFDHIVNRIDYEAELMLMDSPKRFGIKSPSNKEINEARCEFIRILRLLENKLNARLLANETKEPGEDFDVLEKRVKEFQDSEEGDINDLEDSYVKLVLDITQMANAVESNIFGCQTILYVSCGSILGSLFHLTDVYLTNEQTDFIG